MYNDYYRYHANSMNNLNFFENKNKIQNIKSGCAVEES